MYENNLNTQATANSVSRRIFAPMFRARWQNMQNIVTDTAFVNQLPASYRTYYQAFIAQWLAWARGFVPALHQAEFFSTGMGYTVCDVFARLCMSGGFRVYSDDPRAKDYIDSWARDRELEGLLNTMFFFSNSGGNALLVLTPIDEELYPSVYPVDRAVFAIGRTGDISSVTLYNRFAIGESSAIYARETRIMMRGRPFYRVELAPSGGIATAPSWGGATLKTVPESIRAQFEYNYGKITPGEWYEMPPRMKSLGVYNVKNKSVAVALADLPGYSDSTLHTALDVLYSIDYNYTQAQVDQYLGKSRTLVPKGLTSPRYLTLSNGESYREAITAAPYPLDETIYDFIPSDSVEGDPLKPYHIQPDLRGETHKYIRDSDLELLASKVGLSSSTLANHLANNHSGTKTDDEISAENSTDEVSVANKRALAALAINKMLSDVAYFYGFDTYVELKFGQNATNTARKNQELLADYQAGTLPLREYLKRRWADLSEDEVEQMAEAIEAERQQSAENQRAALFREMFPSEDDE